MQIKLRKIEPTDLPFLYQWENDASVWADGANHNPLSQQDLRNYIESTTGDIYRDGQLRLIIEDEATLGCIDLFDFDPRNRRAAIGMYIAPEHRGKGVGKEALRLLCRDCNKKHSLHHALPQCRLRAVASAELDARR